MSEAGHRAGRGGRLGATISGPAVAEAFSPVRTSPERAALRPAGGAVRSAAVAILALLLSSCMTPGPQDPVRVGPFYHPGNHAGEPSLGGIRRVVVLPVWSGNVAPSESAAALDETILTALQGENRFEAVPLTRAECLRRFRAEALSSSSALPHDFLATLKREFAADAVLFIDLTVYQPYSPLGLGFRSKLATIDGTRLVWTFDNLFLAEDPLVANAARHHFLHRDRTVPADQSQAVLQSPSRFASYAASAMFATLPPVNLPPPGQKAPRRRY